MTMDEEDFVLDDEPLFEMLTNAGPCFGCQRWDRDNIEEHRCSAFKTRQIPDEIWSGRNLHDQPYPGDGGLQFEQVK